MSIAAKELIAFIVLDSDEDTRMPCLTARIITAAVRITTATTSIHSSGARFRSHGLGVKKARVEAKVFLAVLCDCLCCVFEQKWK